MQAAIRNPLCAALIVLAGGASGARVPEPIERIAVGQTVHLTLDKGESKDYLITVPQGKYFAVLDAKRTDDQSSNIQVTIQMLKANGTLVDRSWLRTNEIATAIRVGNSYTAPKSFAGRLRISHQQDVPIEMWLTVLPASSMKFLPFAFGGDVTPARIGAEQGVGGTLEPVHSAYHRIALQPGKWTVSLGLKLPAAEKSNLQGQVDLLDPYGFTQQARLVTVNEIDNQARKEGSLVVTKPRTVLFRVTNTNHNHSYEYDLTIEKAQ